MNGRGEISRRELLLVVFAACLAAVVMHWPLVLNLGDEIPKDLGDPLPQAWQVAWGGHALANQPLEFFQSNQFWPVDDSLAFGDALIGYAPAGLIGEGPHDAVVRYDLLFLFAYALAFLGAYLLAREIGIGPAGAAVAGAAFAFAPFRLEQNGHMQVISSGGIPLCLALFVRGARLRSPLWLVAGWLVAGWQLSLGFALGLPLAYLLAGAVVAIIAAWLWRGRSPLDRRLVIAGLGGALVFIAIALLIARPYFRVADEHPEAKRPPSVVEAYSGPAEVFLTAPEENLVWGDATAELRDELENVPEKTLFPGLVILVLALIGLTSARLDRRLRIGLGAGVVAISVLALGFQEEDGLIWPYRALYEALPGWEAIRTPGRLVTFSSLGLALLAAAGAEWSLKGTRLWLAGRRLDVGPRGASVVAGALATLLVAAVVVEGRGLPFDPNDDQEQPAVPEPPASTAETPDPQIHLPAERAEDNRRYLLWSTDGFPEMVNGRASTVPDLIEDVIAEMDGFPDPSSVARLRELGVRSVILHTDRAEGTPQEDAAAAPIGGLGLARERLPGGLVVYGVRSPSAGSGSS
ncbi:MAG: hypothetical protein ACRDL6_08030, partial [Solirubrobacterales bacterium]